MGKRYVDQKEFNGLVAGICRDLSVARWRPDYIVGITRGGLSPAAMISHYLDIKMHALNVSFRNGEQDLETNCWMAEDAFGYDSNPDGTGVSKSYKRKNILIVDDINDSGKTINWIMDDWQASCLPDDPAWKDVWNGNVKFAVIFDNLHSDCRVKMDFSGEELIDEKKDWIVFPTEEWWK